MTTLDFSHHLTPVVVLHKRFIPLSTARIFVFNYRSDRIKKTLLKLMFYIFDIGVKD
jgi:hypothetical protein